MPGRVVVDALTAVSVDGKPMWWVAVCDWCGTREQATLVEETYEIARQLEYNPYQLALLVVVMRGWAVDHPDPKQVERLTCPACCGDRGLRG
jgi:hypothetical protein